MNAYTPLDLAALLRVPNVDPYNGFAVSPEGRRLFFSWNPSGQWEIYRIELDQPGEPVRLTDGPGAKTAPHISPDGSRLAYLVDQNGSEAFDLWLLDLQSGRSRSLTPDSEYALQPNLSWSPDGSRIACISSHSGQFCTYILDAAGQEPVQSLTDLPPELDGTGPQWDVHFSPDGKNLAITAEGTGQDHHTWVLRTGEPRSARRIAIDDRPINAREVCWSPDGSRVIFSSDAPGDYQIAAWDVATGAVEWLTTGSGSKSEPQVAANGSLLAYVAAVGADTFLHVQPLPGGETRRFQVEPGVHFAPTFTPDDQAIIFIFDSPSKPDDLWRLDLTDGSLKQLTRSLPLDLAQAAFVMPEHIQYSAPDGLQVPALLYLPGGRERCLQDKPPAVIVIHGGPNWLFQYLWYPFMSHLAGRGWVVLAPNYRGSTGYGRDWQLANRFDMGRGDTLDVAAGAEYLIREGLVDPRRIAVTGRSHGGYLTMTCLTMHPELWAGGSAVVPFLNWFTSHAASRIDLKHWDIENMGDPREHADRWRERSPFFFLDRIQAPVQLICGAHDPRCPASESIAAHQALLDLGKEAELILYPDEGHTFLKTENVIDHELRRAAFIARLMENPPLTESGA